MSVFTKAHLSGSTDGKGILITTIATPGDLIHTAVAGVVENTFDEVWLWAYTGHVAALIVTVEFGGVIAPDNSIVMSIPYKAGPVPIVPGFILQNGLLVRVFCASANLVTITGFVNQIRP